MQISLRRKNIEVSQEMRERLERRLAFALDRVGSRVTDVTVFVEDGNGPRGGIDKRCAIVVRLAPSGKLVLEERDSDLGSLFDRAADRLGRTVRRELSRRFERRREPALRA